MKKILAAFAATSLLIVAGPAPAADVPATATVPTADQVLERYVEAVGGRAALEKIKSRVVSGRLELAKLGAGGAFKQVSKAPDKEVSTIEFEGIGTIREGYDGTNAWSAAPFQGVTVKSGEDLARVQRTSRFPRELKLKETYSRFEFKGAAKVEAADAWLIEAIPQSGKPDKLYFDQKSGLLIREETIVSSLIGTMTFQNDLGDYREVDGVKVPFSMRLPNPAELGFTVKIDEVKHNVDIADSEFAKPKS